ncbi:MAG: 5-(carboxyamino)imidazole ribonucleotide mutase [Ruminococcaceae bacterium]|nr:5-(carboxyamino)imidazole ribonucleotide mutase [Oscillospiraceae bacterium]
MKKTPSVLIILGSDSDLPVMEDCLKTLTKFDINYSVTVCSAHRTPDRAHKIAKSARKDGYECIIAAAGMAAHLPGVVAAFTTLPVIGVPIKGSVLDGMDAMLSMTQMPPGIPVATVAVNGATNSAVLAAQILSVKYKDIAKKMIEYKAELAAKVDAKDAALQKKLSRADI